MESRNPIPFKVASKHTPLSFRYYQKLEIGGQETKGNEQAALHIILKIASTKSPVSSTSYAFETNCTNAITCLILKLSLLRTNLHKRKLYKQNLKLIMVQP